MKIYNYHPITKEYLSQGLADESPLEENVFLLPANATFLKPPETGENQIPVFENDHWSVKYDFRGKVYYKKDSKERIIITEIGIYPDKNLTNIAPGEFDRWDFELYSWVEDMELVARIQQEKIDQEAKKFLNETDWKVIRHRDQLDLGIETSLTNNEFIELLRQRQEARNRVMEINNATS